MKTLRVAAAAAVAVCAAAVSTVPAHAEWPERAVTVIVPWAAGGGTDATARIVAAELQKKFKQPFNVVNRTGGGGLVGHAAIASSPADGYTLGVITIEMTMFQAQGLAGATPESFTYLGRFNADPIGINVSAASPYKTAKELVDAVKANPGKIKASGANRGGLSHLAWVGLLAKLGMDPNASPWVASDGSAPAMQQLAAEAIEVVSTSPAEAQPLVDSGKARTLAVMSNERVSNYPNLPAMPEALGVQWSPLPFRALAAPVGVPDEVKTKVSAALKDITADPEFVKFMNSRGFSVAYQDSATFTKTVKDSAANLVDAMKAVGLAK